MANCTSRTYRWVGEPALVEVPIPAPPSAPWPGRAAATAAPRR